MYDKVYSVLDREKYMSFLIAWIRKLAGSGRFEVECACVC